MGAIDVIASYLIMRRSAIADGGRFEALQEVIASGGKSDAAAIAALLSDA
jgi:hypothetical protein